jgi:hypothetical protein
MRCEEATAPLGKCRIAAESLLGDRDRQRLAHGSALLPADLILLLKPTQRL